MPCSRINAMFASSSRLLQQQELCNISVAAQHCCWLTGSRQSSGKTLSQYLGIAIGLCKDSSVAKKRRWVVW